MTGSTCMVLRNGVGDIWYGGVMDELLMLWRRIVGTKITIESKSNMHLVTGWQY